MLMHEFVGKDKMNRVNCVRTQTERKRNPESVYPFSVNSMSFLYSQKFIFHYSVRSLRKSKKVYWLVLNKAYQMWHNSILFMFNLSVPVNEGAHVLVIFIWFVRIYFWILFRRVFLAWVSKVWRHLAFRYNHGLKNPFLASMIYTVNWVGLDKI